MALQARTLLSALQMGRTGKLACSWKSSAVSPRSSAVSAAAGRGEGLREDGRAPCKRDAGMSLGRAKFPPLCPESPQVAWLLEGSRLSRAGQRLHGSKPLAARTDRLEATLALCGRAAPLLEPGALAMTASSAPGLHSWHTQVG